MLRAMATKPQMLLIGLVAMNLTGSIERNEFQQAFLSVLINFATFAGSKVSNETQSSFGGTFGNEI